MAAEIGRRRWLGTLARGYRQASVYPDDVPPGRFTRCQGIAMSTDLQAKIDRLSRPEAYPEDSPTVEVVTTHMSCVFLTAQHAYKLKKPVRYPFLDFSTIEARHRDCVEEVRLNRRLAPGVYLRVVPLAAGPTGRLTLGGEGRLVDWLVQMRRLPKELMLDQLIHRGEVTDDDVRRFTRTLSDFYRQACAERLGPADYRYRLAQDIRQHALELSEPAYGLPTDLATGTAAVLLAVLEKDRRLFDRRVRDRKILEGHGDLRPEHICIGPLPLFIDCLEFNRGFRIVDPADELAYLALECEYAAAPRIGELVLDTYAAATGDRPPARVVHFHKACRALLRAKLSIWHLKDHEAGETARWGRRARRYLDLAGEYCGRL
ncbi:MAG TPA: hypothetical protein VKA76_07370 [Gammaproteobacteria bacterium]|nr:hypothetical protein [Gammaproteobacteria bacterium]